MHNPARDLPRTIHSSMLLVLCLFLAANVSYFAVLDPATVASSNTVALDFGRVTIGRFGAVVFSILVAISSFGALSNGFYTSKSDSAWVSSRADRCSWAVDICLGKRSLLTCGFHPFASSKKNARPCHGITSSLDSVFCHLWRRVPL